MNKQATDLDSYLSEVLPKHYDNDVLRNRNKDNENYDVFEDAQHYDSQNLLEGLCSRIDLY